MKIKKSKKNKEKFKIIQRQGDATRWNNKND